MRVRMEELFRIKSGDIHALHELGVGNIPLVSCGDLNHGYKGRFDIPPELRYSEVITVAYNGKPLTAKFRPYEFGAKDDIGILFPRRPIGDLAQVYVAAALNRMRWRFSYGRKCFKTKLNLLEIDVPVIRDKDGVRMDEAQIAETVGEQELDVRPKLKKPAQPAMPFSQWTTRRLSEMFDLQRGDFHSLGSLSQGNWPTVSRTENDNGVVGYYERPDGSNVYPPGRITVSTVSGDAFVQVEHFIVTDNVIVCVPLFDMRTTTAYFLAAMINQQKWRYSYGRQCYKEKLSTLSIQVPWVDERIDEDVIESVVKNQPYWPFVKSHAAP